jgi:hypothetical protein
MLLIAQYPARLKPGGSKSEVLLPDRFEAWTVEAKGPGGKQKAGAVVPRPKSCQA